MKSKKGWLIVMAVILLATYGLLFAWNHVFAQPECPLAEMALQESDLPDDVEVLSAGPTSFDDASQPINSENSRSFGVHEFLEAHKVSFLGKQIHGGHYLYRYRDSAQAEEQAARLVVYALQDERLQPTIVEKDSAPQGVKGQVVRFISPDTGGVYYWFIGVTGRTLVLLFVGGPLNEETRTSFNLLKLRVQECSVP